MPAASRRTLPGKLLLLRQPASGARHPSAEAQLDPGSSFTPAKDSSAHGGNRRRSNGVSGQARQGMQEAAVSQVGLTTATLATTSSQGSRASTFASSAVGSSSTELAAGTQSASAGAVPFR